MRSKPAERCAAGRLRAIRQRSLVGIIVSLALPLAACGTTEAVSVSVNGQDASPASDAADGSAGARDTDTPPDETSLDAEEDGPREPLPPRPAPELPTPTRSERTDRLFCGLNNGQLVQGALRGAACLNLPASGFLDELSRGPFYGEVLLAGYREAGYGSCTFLRCLNDATDCEAAERCNLEHRREVCDYGRDVSRCDGSTLEACIFSGAGGTNRWFAVTDCDRVGGACAEEPCGEGESCDRRAACVGPEMRDDCPYYGDCDGNVLVRCMPPAVSPFTALPVRLPCDEVVEGGTCILTPVGGELPGPACAVAEPDCVNAFSNTACTDDSHLALCLFGRQLSVDCAAYGYDRCSPGEPGLDSRCLP